MAIVDKTNIFEEYFKVSKDGIESTFFFGDEAKRRKLFSLTRKNIGQSERFECLGKIMNGEFFEDRHRFADAFGKDLEKFFGNEDFIRVFRRHRLSFYMIGNRVNQEEELAKVVGFPAEMIHEILSDTSKHYSRFFIWKDEAHTKKRWIEAPDATLKEIQKRILYNIVYKMAPTKYAHGFVHKKSIVSCANEHTGKKFVLKLDLKNFFPSITMEMLYGAMYDEVNSENVKYIIPAMEMCLLQGRLPQGAPTSPALSNIVCKPLDLMFSGIAKKFDLNYTRYADDLIFSGDSDEIYKVIPIIKGAIQRFGLTVNEKKVKVLKKHQRQTVTGLVVNAEGKTSVRRRKRLNLRAYMHHILTGKHPIERVNMNRLRGDVNLINMANPAQGRWFVEKLEEIVAMMR